MVPSAEVVPISLAQALSVVWAAGTCYTYQLTFTYQLTILTIRVDACVGNWNLIYLLYVQQALRAVRAAGTMARVATVTRLGSTSHLIPQ